MSEIIVARDSDIVAAEINAIKDTTRRTIIAGCLAIGEKLVEAKSLVEHGQWGKWLEEKVSYSQSTANNLMKLYQEYGGQQESLFDNWTNSEAFAKMSYTQHMAMLALPFAERAEFAETHQVDEMSTRQLEQAVRERVKALEAELEGANARAAEATGQYDAKVEEMSQQIRAVQTDLKKAEAQKKKAEEDRDRAERSEKNALNLVKKLEAQYADAKAQQINLQAELEAARQEPEVPESVMEELRREAAAEAAKQAAEEIEKKLAAAKKEAADAMEAKAAADVRAKNMEEKLEAAQRAARMNAPDTAVFKVHFAQIQQAWDSAMELYKQAVKAESDTVDVFYNALAAVLNKFQSELGGKHG